MVTLMSLIICRFFTEESGNNKVWFGVLAFEMMRTVVIKLFKQLTEGVQSVWLTDQACCFLKFRISYVEAFTQYLNCPVQVQSDVQASRVADIVYLPARMPLRVCPRGTPYNCALFA